jgi:CubicO group peptidase (beta-lactamase class C family)
LRLGTNGAVGRSARGLALLAVLAVLAGCARQLLHPAPVIYPVHGLVAPGFEEVRDEFCRNFTERGEVGAACAAYWQGRKVVDLWGGFRDERTRAPWQESTLVMVFSATKGVSSVALAVAHSRGLVDYDTPVARYWPEFGRNGKESITVRELLSHQAGLPVLDRHLTRRLLADPDSMAAILAAQRPAWEPGTKQGYHAVTPGWYESELLRRVDPAHRTFGRFFQDEIARPLGIEFYIGLPESVPESRIARLRVFNPCEVTRHLFTMPAGMIAGFLNPWSMTSRAFFNPALGARDLNDRAYLGLESPASSGVGQVRAIARVYGALATGGRELGITRGTLEALEEAAPEPVRGATDVVTHDHSVYTLGYVKPPPEREQGCSDRAFGMMGLGGAYGFADPGVQVGFAYAPNRMGFGMHSDPREQALQKAFYRCLARMR